MRLFRYAESWPNVQSTCVKKLAADVRFLCGQSGLPEVYLEVGHVAEPVENIGLVDLDDAGQSLSITLK
jgi:hypothetical protein